MAIIIEKHNEAWPQQFDELKHVLSDVLVSVPHSIEHVGSTAVPGLAAKPVIDIDIIIDNDKELDRVILSLAGVGYRFAGDMGITGRYAFKRSSDDVPHTTPGRTWPGHHLYCCIAGSVSLNNHLLFRDALRRDPELAKAYAALKQELASSTSDMNVYVESKSSFIETVLRHAGFTSETLERINRENKSSKR